MSKDVTAAYVFNGDPKLLRAGVYKAIANMNLNTNYDS